MKNKTINKETYSVIVFCKNCSYGHDIGRHLWIEKGLKSDITINSKKCPVCGCYTLEKSL